MTLRRSNITTVNLRRIARAYEYGMQPHWLSDELLDQLDGCKSEEARRLLVYGIGKKRRRPFRNTRGCLWIHPVEGL